MRGALYVALAIALAGCTVTSPPPDTPPQDSPETLPTAGTSPPSMGPGPPAPDAEPEVPTPTIPHAEPTPDPAPPSPPSSNGTVEPATPEADLTPTPTPTPTPSSPAPTTSGGSTGATAGPAGSAGGSPGGASGGASAPSGSTVPLFTIEPGLDAAGGSFLRSWSRDADGRGFAADIRAVPGATLVVDSLARIATEATPVTVSLSAPAVADVHVVEAKFFLMNGTALVAALDLLDPTPVANATLQPRSTYDVAWRYTLDADASAPVNVSLQIAATP